MVGLTETPDELTFATTWTTMSPILSSIMAAAVSTVPCSVLLRPQVLRPVKAVPRLVEQSVAPAANAWSGVGDARQMRAKDIVNGVHSPMAATAIESKKSFPNAEADVDKPPTAKLTGAS